MARLADIARVTRLHASQTARRAGNFLRRRSRVEIAAYRGFGTAGRAYLHGRVLLTPGYSKPAATDRAWRNLWNTYRRGDASPVPFVEVRLAVGDTSRLVRADDEGFFGGWVDLPAGAVEGDGWLDAKLELAHPPKSGESVTADAKWLVAPPSARFGVISDIDDTVIQSRITSFLQAARTVMLGNALTRLPFAGVAKLYSALHDGIDGKRRNPLFYVSSSPWNIYDIIEDFLTVQGIPVGPLLLRDWDISIRSLTSKRHHSHKGEAIKEILDAHPSLPFILIGDDSQQDPEIYHKVVHDYPERILAVYIRQVVRAPQREAAITALATEVAAARSTLLIARDSHAVAVDAAKRGWIPETVVAEIDREVAADAGLTDEKKPPDQREAYTDVPPARVNATMS